MALSYLLSLSCLNTFPRDVLNMVVEFWRLSDKGYPLDDPRARYYFLAHLPPERVPLGRYIWHALGGSKFIQTRLICTKYVITRLQLESTPNHYWRVLLISNPHTHHHRVEIVAPVKGARWSRRLRITFSSLQFHPHCHRW